MWNCKQLPKIRRGKVSPSSGLSSLLFLDCLQPEHEDITLFENIGNFIWSMIQALIGYTCIYIYIYIYTYIQVYKHNSVTVQNRTHVYMYFFLSQRPRKSPPAVMSTSRETPCIYNYICLRIIYIYYIPYYNGTNKCTHVHKNTFIRTINSNMFRPNKWP